MHPIFKQALAPWAPPAPPAPGVGEYVFEFDHPNGDTLTCHLEYDAGDPSEPERMTLVNAYLGAVDVHGLLPLPIIDQIEAEALRDPS